MGKHSRMSVPSPVMRKQYGISTFCGKVYFSPQFFNPRFIVHLSFNSKCLLCSPLFLQHGHMTIAIDKLKNGSCLKTYTGEAKSHIIREHQQQTDGRATIVIFSIVSGKFRGNLQRSAKECTSNVLLIMNTSRIISGLKIRQAFPTYT